MSPTHRMSKHSSSSSESHMPWSLWPKHSQLKWASRKYNEISGRRKVFKWSFKDFQYLCAPLSGGFASKITHFTFASPYLESQPLYRLCQAEQVYSRQPRVVWEKWGLVSFIFRHKLSVGWSYTGYVSYQFLSGTSATKIVKKCVRVGLSLHWERFLSFSLKKKN